MNKNLALVLGILNVIVFVLYFTNTSRVELYQWIITPLFAVLFIGTYLNARKNSKYDS